MHGRARKTLNDDLPNRYTRCDFHVFTRLQSMEGSAFLTHSVFMYETVKD